MKSKFVNIRKVTQNSENNRNPSKTRNRNKVSANVTNNIHKSSTTQIQNKQNIPSNDQVVVQQTNNQPIQKQNIRKPVSLSIQRSSKIFSEDNLGNHKQTIANPFVCKIDQYLDRLSQQKRPFSNKTKKVCHEHPINEIINPHKQKKMKTIYNAEKLDYLEQKLNKQKRINRKLQKGMLQLQKILWNRSEKLQQLQTMIISQQKHNSSVSIKTKKPSFKNTSNEKKIPFFNTNTQLNQFLSFDKEYSQVDQDSEIKPQKTYLFTRNNSYAELEDQYNRIFDTIDGQRIFDRRRTQAPSELQRVISATLGLGKNSSKKIGKKRWILHDND